MKKNLYHGLYLADLVLAVSNQGKKNNTAIEPNIRRTPANLSGTALKIA